MREMPSHLATEPAHPTGFEPAISGLTGQRIGPNYATDALRIPVRRAEWWCATPRRVYDGSLQGHSPDRHTVISEPCVDRVGFEPLELLARESCYRYITQPIVEFSHASTQQVDIFGVLYAEAVGLEPTRLFRAQPFSRRCTAPMWQRFQRGPCGDRTHPKQLCRLPVTLATSWTRAEDTGLEPARAFTPSTD